MRAEKWTPEQEAAIRLQGTLLVAAGAGSGKTAVLVERLIQRIIDPAEHLDVRSLLVVTFTKAAAAEMAERVRKALENRIFQEEDPQESEWLIQQLNFLNQANICNLHSFCLDLIRRYFYELGLDPAFRVADPVEMDLLKQDVLTEVLEAHYQKTLPGFELMASALNSDRSDDALTELIFRLSDFSYTQVNPEEWLRGLVGAYSWDSREELLKSPWGEAVWQKVTDELDAVWHLLQEALKLTQTPSPLCSSSLHPCSFAQPP